MTVLRKIILSACVLALCLGAAPAVLGDWNPGDPNKMHYPQEPDPLGWDICVNCQWVADDFICTQDGPISDIHFWISWLDDDEGWTNIQNWEISIWSDATGGPGTCQMQPGQRMWTWDGVGTLRTRPYGFGDEGWHCPSALWSVPNDHTNYFQVNITNIANPYIQQAGTTYWLVIKVWLVTDPPPVPGWKTSLNAWRCRALWSLTPDAGGPWKLVDTGTPMGTDPVYHDMAFVITGPEPSDVDHGDAPEGDTANPVIAYPSLGVNGAFPTCRTIGTAGFIEHGLGWARFEPPAGPPGWDAEPDGDAGLCPPPGCFPTYDDDECFADMDAGLMLPDAYTIDNLLNVVPCPAGVGTALGYVCNNAVWGQDIDIWVNNQMPVDGYVSVLADWQQDGVWAGFANCPGAATPEYILQDWGIPSGYSGPLSGTMPFPTSFLIGPNSGYVWFRFTITPIPINNPLWDGSGSFEDGESEDYLLRVDACQPPPDIDWGDAPDNTPVAAGYPTKSTNNGANHVIGGPWFGDSTDVPDPEPDGQPDAWATGDDLDAQGDDEDGVTIPVLVQGQTDNITFEVNGGGGQVNIWIDWNADMDWNDAGEKVEDNWYGNGIWSVSVTPPLNSVVGQTFLRARISTDGSLPPGGAASDGEVEDHEVSIEQAPEELDFGDAPDPNYPTLLASNGARHIITPGPHFCAAAGGGMPDPEPDGQPDPQALGDDNDGNDDEDGVSFPTLVQWVPANIVVNVCDNGAGGGGIVQIWIDFNGSGGWETGEQIFNGWLPTGVHNVPVTAPIGSVVGTTFARCRISSVGGLRPEGLANDGEVEDYTVDIEENPTIKWAQLPDTSPNGIDIKVTGQWLADDFECTSYGPITDVHLWCSWKYDDVGEITNLHLSFHSDDPVGPGGSDPCNEYSKPDGDPLWERDFPPSEFSMTAVKTLADGEWWWDPVRDDLIFPGDFTIWRIDVNIPADEAFVQDGDPCNPVIYWMDVRADVEGELTELGWKTRRYPEHFADDAVFHWGELPFFWKELRYPEDHPYYPNSIDMAFVITGEEWERPKEPVPHLKWSQPPIEWDPTLIMPLYCGWDQESWTVSPDTYWLGVADDFRCLGTMPVASVHWYGSYVGWQEDLPPDPRPSAWRIGFWSNVPANPTGDPPYSHPGTLLWQVEAPANRVEIEWIGKDRFPDMPLETCFQYYVKFEPDEYFWQHEYVTADAPDDVFWISIAAIYPTGTDVPWGWKTRPWSWMDDAVTFEHLGPLDPGVALDPGLITPIENPLTQESMDVAFELDTDPCYIKWEQPFTGIRHWPHYEDVLSMGIQGPITEYKWWQEPDPMGWDVCVTGWRLADDWLCNQTGPVSDIHFWISSERDQPFEILSIDVEVYSDNPVGPQGHSEPNVLLWQRSFVPGEFDMVPYGQGDQGWLEPDGMWQRPDHLLFWLVNIGYIPDPHWQNEGTIYWLSIHIEAEGHVGWKTTIDHWNDDAVYQDPTGIGWHAMTDPLTGVTIDLAFALTTQKDFDLRALAADDWPCDTNRPVTAVAWWGSYLGYQYEACQGLQTVPPIKPDYFELAIWDDVPVDPCDPTSYSHPNNIIWEYKTRDYDEVLVGYDKHPHGDPNEPVFRYSVRLPRETWFFQRDVNAVYWLSVLAVWDVNQPDYDWGWTNHEHVYNDDAVSGYMELDPSGLVNWIWSEIFDQTGASADMSFILFTDPDPNLGTCWDLGECGGQPKGDINCDGNVNFIDLGLMKVAFFSCVGDANYNCCADLNHDGCVNFIDLGILKVNFFTIGHSPATGEQSCPPGY